LAQPFSTILCVTSLLEEALNTQNGALVHFSLNNRISRFFIQDIVPKCSFFLVRTLCLCIIFSNSFSCSLSLLEYDRVSNYQCPISRVL
jgi:hypothetical protein